MTALEECILPGLLYTCTGLPLGCLPLVGSSAYPMSKKRLEEACVNDERKTKKKLIAELETLRGEVADKDGQLEALRQQVGRDVSVVERQLAVERVRAEAMAMRKSANLFNVVSSLYQELANLGLNVPMCFINFYIDTTEKGRIRSYRAFSNPAKHGIAWKPVELIAINEDVAAVVEEVPFISDSWLDWWRGGEMLVRACDLEEIAGIEVFYRDFFQHYKFDQKIESFDVVDIPFEYGSIGLWTVGYGEEHGLIAQEFTDVISFGYLRFLDFQRLEEQAESLKEQAEQARRERAVERVRAEVMAMRNSDDLLKVVGAVKREMNEIGIETERCFINFVDEEAENVHSYQALVNPRTANITWTSSELVEIDDQVVVVLIDIAYDTLAEDWIEKWKSGRVWTEPSPSSPKMPEWFTANYGLVGGDWPFSAQAYTNVEVPFTYGTIRVQDLSYDEDHVAIIQELAEAISLGYIRFLDFLKVDQAQKSLIDELEEELQTAHDLQMGLMPSESPQIDGLDITGRCIPANHVGGDFFQYFQQDGKLSVCMADVTGHAMEAAVPVMMFSGVLKTEMRHGAPLSELFGQLNRTMHESLDSRTFVCFTMVELDLADRTLQFANSGCPYPYHYHASTGAVSELQVDAYPLGVRAETAYKAIETSLEKGDYFVFCSDGIIEAANADEDIFGFEQTAETIRKACSDGLSAEALIDRLIGAVQAFAGDTPQGDDMTCVVLRDIS